MSNTILNIHIIFASIFMLYIFFDRVYIRNWIEESKREKIYKKIKFPMLFISAILIISGGILLINFISFSTVFKTILALILIASFFYCPFFMKKEVSFFKRLMYRYFVLILTIAVFTLGLYL